MSQQSKTPGNPKLGGIKKSLIIKCCLCKTKPHIVPSRHNSPGKPSTYLTREEAGLLHGGGVVAAYANSTSNLLCDVLPPCAAFHAGSEDIQESPQPLQNICASPISTEISIFLILPFYIPCLFLPLLLDTPYQPIIT